MITEQQIRNLVEEKITETGHFLVDISVSSTNAIAVEVDHVNGVPVLDCIQISRYIESNLDREVEDFELKVSSPGLDKPLRVTEQYQKNIGRGVQVVMLDGSKQEGVLTEVTDSGIVFTSKKKERIEGRKAKHWVETNHEAAFAEIKETKIVISFK